MAILAKLQEFVYLIGKYVRCIRLCGAFCDGTAIVVESAVKRVRID